MIIKYYKGYININTLNEMAKTNRNGTTLFHLKDVLCKIGFDCEGVKCSFDTLINNNISMPCICHVTINSSYKHFVVIYEINKDYIIIGDPSQGIKRIPLFKFKDIYNGVILLATPIKTIPYINDYKYYTFIKILKRNYKTFKLLILYSFFFTLLSIINSFYFGKLVDNVDKDKDILFFIFIIFFSINIIKIIVEYIKNKIFIYLNRKIDIELTKDIFTKLLLLPYKYYKNRTTGDIISRIDDLTFIKDMLNKIIISIFIDIPIVLLSSIILFKINIKLFIICFINCIITLLLIIVFNGFNKKFSHKLKTLKSVSTSSMIESINGFETIKGLNISKNIKNKVLSKYIDYVDYQTYYSGKIFNQTLILNLINTISFLFISYFGAMSVFKNIISLSSLVTFNTIYNYFYTSISNIIEINTYFLEFRLTLKRINELLINKESNGFLNYFTNGDICFQNLSYTFNDKINVLKDINLLIKKGEKVLVIGKSGSGKSTLFKLLKGYYKIDMDRIMINDIDINNYVKNTLDEKIKYVSQNEILFNDTILNNITLNESFDNKFLEIMKICEIDDIINKNDLGYNFLVEEGGFNLSGGQKQRISLARTLLRDFEILILDEALNQIDIKLERKILINIFNKYSDKTFIIISHRLNNNDLFDRIVELNEGKIIRNVSR